MKITTLIVFLCTALFAGASDLHKLFIPLVPTPIATPIATVSQEVNELVYLQTLMTMEKIFINAGDKKKTATYLKPYLDSAWRVSSMVSNFPTADPVTNAHLFFSYGAQESQFERNFVEVNIPGTIVVNGMKIKHFSLDYGWVGLNEQHLEWTYAVAKCLQDGKPDLPKPWRHYISRATWAWMKGNVHVPKSLWLKRINPQTAKDAKAEWRMAQAKKIPWREFKKGIVIDYAERGPDELDSVLLYRMLVQIDRKMRGWDYNSWNKVTARKLQTIRKKYNLAA